MQADAFGDKVLVRCGGRERTYEGTRGAAAAFAGALSAAGVACGDRVAALCENKLELLDLLLGCAWLGAIFVPLNTALRGPQLEHELRSAGAKILAIDPSLVASLDSFEDELPMLERLWVVGDSGGSWRGRALEAFPDPAQPVPAHPARPGETAVILYTSGTTGPSKGVLCPHAQWYWWGTLAGRCLELEEGDVLHTTLPLFHSNAIAAFFQALLAGATYVIGPWFSASAFWRRLVEAEATVTYLLGAMVTILVNQPPGPDERGHEVRVALAPATPAELFEPFRERFGVRLLDAWGSTETNAVIWARWSEQRPGTMGRVADGFEAIVADGDDQQVPDGTPGELLIRHREPYSISTGYHELPEKTLEAWRNLWFHTGDRVVREQDGYFRFLDRLKDSIRRRGENISAWEVERVLQSHPEVDAVAVVPVPAELGEDEILVCVVLREGAKLEPAELVSYCEPRLAYFAIPRYVDFIDELPLTANGKVEKYKLRERGVTPTTWDRERAGIELHR